MKKLLIFILTLTIMLSSIPPNIKKVAAAGQSNDSVQNSMQSIEQATIDALKAAATALHSAGNNLVSSASFLLDSSLANTMSNTGQWLKTYANSLVNTSNGILPSDLSSGAGSTAGSTEAMSQAQQSLSDRWSTNSDVVTQMVNYQSESTFSSVHVPGDFIQELLDFFSGSSSNGSLEGGSVVNNYKPDSDLDIVGDEAIGHEGLGLIDALMLESIEQAENIFTAGGGSHGSTEGNGSIANGSEGTTANADELGDILSDTLSMFTEYSDMINQLADSGQEFQQFLQGLDPEMQQQIINELNLNDMGFNGNSPDTQLPFTHTQTENENFSLLPPFTPEQLEQIGNLNESEFSEFTEAVDTVVEFFENLGDLFGDDEESDLQTPPQNTQLDGETGEDSENGGADSDMDGNNSSEEDGTQSQESYDPSDGGSAPSGGGDSSTADVESSSDDNYSSSDEGSTPSDGGDGNSGDGGDGSYGGDGGDGEGDSDGGTGASGTAGAGISGNGWFGGYADNQGGMGSFGAGMFGATPEALADPNYLGIAVKKPNIYIYSPVETKVTISFAGPTRIIESIPKYDPDIGWNVKISPNGIIDNKYSYLFYEAVMNEKDFQKERGWIIRHHNRSLVFGYLLDNYGFNKKEIEDFIAFWSEALESDKDYRMYPQESEIVNRLFPIYIKPYPDKLSRIWFYFEESPFDVDIEPPKEIERVSHNGFAIVEWGGMIGSKSIYVH